MKRNSRTAFNALLKINATVIDHCQNGESLDNQWGADFILSAEDMDSDGRNLADYYQEMVREQFDDSADVNAPNAMILNGRVLMNAFGIREDVHRILRANALRAEWIDGGTIGIYQD